MGIKVAKHNNINIQQQPSIPRLKQYETHLLLFESHVKFVICNIYFDIP